MYEDIDKFIAKSKKPAEIKRALTVKQDLLGKSRKLIGEILEVSSTFISKWRQIYDAYGAEAFTSYHKGGASRSFLNETQKAEVLGHIREHEVFSPKDLAVYLKTTFNVSFKSGQSYYELLHEARMSYHKSQKVNPKRDEVKIKGRREEIKKN